MFRGRHQKVVRCPFVRLFWSWVPPRMWNSVDSWKSFGHRSYLIWPRKFSFASGLECRTSLSMHTKKVHDWMIWFDRFFESYGFEFSLFWVCVRCCQVNHESLINGQSKEQQTTNKRTCGTRRTEIKNARGPPAAGPTEDPRARRPGRGPRCGGHAACLAADVQIY